MYSYEWQIDVACCNLRKNVRPAFLLVYAVDEVSLHGDSFALREVKNAISINILKWNALIYRSSVHMGRKKTFQ